jgi:hypothetical protein
MGVRGWCRRAQKPTGVLPAHRARDVLPAHHRNSQLGVLEIALARHREMMPAPLQEGAPAPQRAIDGLEG